MACSPGIPMNMGRPAPDPINTASKPSSCRQFIDRNRFTDDYICLDLNAQRFNILDLSSNHRVLRKTELRNTVSKNAARFVQSLEISLRHSPAWPGLPHRSVPPVQNRSLPPYGRSSALAGCGLNSILHGPSPQQTAPAYQWKRLHPFCRGYTDPRTVLSCGHHTAAHCRKGTGLTDDLICFFKIAFFNFR